MCVFVYASVCVFMCVFVCSYPLQVEMIEGECLTCRWHTYYTVPGYIVKPRSSGEPFPPPIEREVVIEMAKRDRAEIVARYLIDLRCSGRLFV